jgi:hypothetical protein
MAITKATAEGIRAIRSDIIRPDIAIQLASLWERNIDSNLSRGVRVFPLSTLPRLRTPVSRDEVAEAVAEVSRRYAAAGWVVESGSGRLAFS